MAKSHNSRASRRLALPSGMNSHVLCSAIENDAVYRDNLLCAIHRHRQSKITDGEFASIRRDLVCRALYRWLRAEHLPVALVPRAEAIIRS